MSDTTTLDPGMSINEVIRTWPATVAAFERLGLDSCCGGPLPVREAAERHGLELDTVLTELERELR
jgi:iron-sulfur cluster repair protein YtfE (RIC family)